MLYAIVHEGITSLPLYTIVHVGVTSLPPYTIVHVGVSSESSILLSIVHVGVSCVRRPEAGSDYSNDWPSQPAFCAVWLGLDVTDWQQLGIDMMYTDIGNSHWGGFWESVLHVT